MVDVTSIGFWRQIKFFGRTEDVVELFFRNFVEGAHWSCELSDLCHWCECFCCENTEACIAFFNSDRLVHFLPALFLFL